MQFFKNICIILSDFLFKIHKKSLEKPCVKKDFTKDRKLVAEIIMDVLVGKISVREGILKFPKNCSDEGVDVAWHALVHFEADEDIARVDDVFRDVQIDFLEGLYNILIEGHELPKNLIAGYNKYHKGVDTCQCSGREYFWHEMKKNISIQD